MKRRHRAAKQHKCSQERPKQKKDRAYILLKQRAPFKDWFDNVMHNNQKKVTS